MTHVPDCGKGGVSVVKLAKRRIPAIQFKQWLTRWDEYEFDAAAHRRKPEPYQYVFSMKAAELRALSEVYRRTRDGATAEGIQRGRDKKRTQRIQRYVKFGYPYGDLQPAQRTEAMNPLRKPGWLPTAIVVNILTAGDVRRGKRVDKKHLIKIANIDGCIELVLPASEDLADASLPPIEVIDGQHRLWAFEYGGEEEPIPDDFELPVVAYYGLDVAWQAYLFWSINVSPKRINPSHAFDLYPLLRTQDWLESVGELTVYREARAQELVEILFTHKTSPWRGRINMLGDSGGGSVSQAAWVRGLLSSFFGTGRGRAKSGLFQSNIGTSGEPLEWSRAQQAAFIVQLWVEIERAISANLNEWWVRQYEKDPKRAFLDKTSMLNQDMGVRAVLAVANDIFFANADSWKLCEWYEPSQPDGATDAEDVDRALASLNRRYLKRYLAELATGIVAFDWRSLEGPGVKEDRAESLRKRAYRGSGGYPLLTRDLLEAISTIGGAVGNAAERLMENL